MGYLYGQASVTSPIGAGVAADKRPAGRRPLSPTSAQQDRTLATGLCGAPRRSTLPLPNPCPAAARHFRHPQAAAGAGSAGEGARSEGSPPAPEQGLHFPGGLGAAAAGAATFPGSGARDFHSCVRRAEPETRPEAELGI